MISSLSLFEGCLFSPGLFISYPNYQAGFVLPLTGIQSTKLVFPSSCSFPRDSSDHGKVNDTGPPPVKNLLDRQLGNGCGRD
jgi:hypothetical protein